MNQFIEMDSSILFVNKNDLVNLSEAEKLFSSALEKIEANTINSRKIARDLLRKAVSIEPQNVKYRITLARQLEESFALSAASEYKKILKIDSSIVDAWIGLAKLREREFSEYHNSKNKVEGGIFFNLEEFAQQDFQEALHYYKSALKYDPNNFEVNFRLAMLYEENDDPLTALKYAEKLIENSSEDYRIPLLLGLLYYKTSRMEKSLTAYQSALMFMNPEERADYKFNSVKALLEPVIGEHYEILLTNELKEVFSDYWKINDPLYLTEYNERLLEHYSRLAQANFRFGRNFSGKKGWLSDRGETLLRYGFPNSHIRLRPDLDFAGRGVQINVKTEIWYYDDKVLGFIDPYSSGEYSFSYPSSIGFVSQFEGNTYEFIQLYRKENHEDYEPKFDGKIIKAPSYVIQFKNLDNSKSKYTDVYFIYSLFKEKDYDAVDNYNHRLGIFYFDSYFQPIYEKRSRINDLILKPNVTAISNKSLLMNTFYLPLPPDTGNISFEIIRDKDKAVAVNRGKIKINDFSGSTLSISDIVLADSISFDYDSPTAIKRKEMNIYPKPYRTNRITENAVIYYEVYNLKLDQQNLTYFKQDLILQKLEEAESKFSIASIAQNFLDLFGITKSGNKVIISTDIQSYSQHPQIYFELDLSGYEPGNYLLSIKITDERTGKAVSNSFNLKLVR
jgi:GWxTD domain-containing protein